MTKLSGIVNRSTTERGGQLIENCVFDSNSHFISSTNSNGGGAIHNWDEDVTIKNCVFGNNESSHSGGAIYSWGNNFVVENSTFQNNYSRANGGAIHLNSNDLHLRNSTFRNNTSETEGGAISNRGTLNVDESIFDNNHAKTNGGAIYNPELMTINFSDFLNNHANEDGGAIYNQRFSEKSYLTQTIFTQNTAKKGGAIYNDSDEGLYFINSLFHLINALEMGGAILNDKKIFITNNTFVENNNTAIVYNHLTTSQNFPYSTNIYNSIFYLNSTKENFRSDLNSKEIDQDASDKDIRRNIVEEYDLGTNNMIGTNPQFINNTSNFRLQTTSPAINAGNNSLYNQVSLTNAASSQDLDKNPRLFGAAIDYGAYELQEIATPTEPNCATITFPTNNKNNVSLTPEITWNAVPDADGYRISIGTSPTNFDVGDETNYNVTTALDENTTYYILVVPYNSVGEAQNCTTISFTNLTNLNEPNCATITFPTNNQNNVSLTPEITWNANPNADGYRISIGTSPTNFDVLDNFDVGDVTNYDITNPLDENTTYYILVVPYNSVGEAQNCTTISFTTLQNTNPCDEDLIINLEIIGNDVKVLLDNGNPPYLYSLNGENHQESNQFFNLPNGNHTLEIITSDGCKKEIQFEILEIHNAITPNGDGINDVLNFSFLMNKENAKLSIFDRYGNTIFIGSRENNFIWNGQLNKNEITTDSYWYLIEWQENETNSIIKISNWILVKNK